MTSASLLNLSLDEIIQRTRRGDKKQARGKQKARKNGAARLRSGQQFQKKSNLSLSLSSRLSGGGVGFKRASGDLRRNITTQSRLWARPDAHRLPVHNRLTITTNAPPRPPPVFAQSHAQPRTRSLKTKGSEDSKPVRITNGAIVTGLRSDQLLLQKLHQRRSFGLRAKMDKFRSLQTKRAQIADKSLLRTSTARGSSAKVSLNVDRGLTVRIANEIVRRQKPRTRRPATPPSDSSSSSSSSSATSPEEEEDDEEEGPYPGPRPPPPPRRPSGGSKEAPSAPSLLRLGVERPPPPKPHRQVLDQLIQKEISVLQGLAEAHSVGPGPGVRGFKMVPCRTRHSLNHRFTVERGAE